MIPSFQGMRDITSPKLLYAKGVLFLSCGTLAGGVLLAERPTVQTAALLGVAVWCFARAYYFAFYVVGRYADPGYRFAGLWSFVRYVVRRRRGVQWRDSENVRPVPGDE